ncbi:MAG: RNA 2',3'-cyclic phosphodiesterase [Methanocalculaceae archaeon]|jgi:2'-5' RNA ligase|nr:RNA 2',3'-cyclic phosphodiesterase [Methanocalculaceae archaeon]
MVRTFIAVESSDKIRNNLAAAAKKLQGTPARLAAVQPPLMHITLKFLGEVPEVQIPRITAVLAKIHAVPYQLTVSRVSTFGKPALIIKADIKDDGATTDLARQIDALLLPINLTKPAGQLPPGKAVPNTAELYDSRNCGAVIKSFSPHLTIARVNEYSPALLPKSVAIENQQFGICRIGEVVLKKSTLTPAGPIYETLAGVKL